MAFTGRIIIPIRSNLAPIRSLYLPISHPSTNPCFTSFGSLKTWMKCFQPVLRNSASTFRFGLIVRRSIVANFSLSGSRVAMGSILGLSAIYGFLNLSPCFAYTDGGDIQLDDYRTNSWGTTPDLKEEPHAILTFSRKIWLPVIFFATLLAKWNHPIALAIKLIIFLLSTKPAPFSVYLLVEQLRHQTMLKSPLVYRLKSLYANKVEVKDYKLLCIAKVEICNQKFTLIGILGGWWTLSSSSSSRYAFSLFKNDA